MSELFNPRRERFVRYYLKTGIASAAYQAAGYKASTRNALDSSASQLLRNPKVKARIGELRRAMTHKTKVTLESLLSDIAEDRAQAKALGQVSAAMQGNQLAARLTGHLIDRKESGAPGEFAGLTSVDVLDLIRRELGDGAANAFQAALKPAESTEQAVEPNVDGSDSLN